MNIIYLISINILLITIILIKKIDKKINIISSIIITIIAFMCYQTIIAYLLDLMKTPITLFNMSIINIILITILWVVYFFKIKKFQSYTIKKRDIIFLIILLIINIPILYRQYGILENFRYISTDSVMHCQAAITFSKSDFLLDSMKNWEAINPTFMIASYVNDGLLMKALVNIIGEFNLYKVYMFTDISYYFMIGYVFYLLITSSKNCNRKSKYILSYVISILFMIGYPLNSIITGFHYFTLGILEFITILYIIEILHGENKKIMYILLFLLNTAIMLTYNLLAPIIYLAEFFYFIYEKIKVKEKLLTKKSILELIIIFIIPGIIGLSFFLLPRILENIVLENQQQLWIDGYIYINYWSNIIIFIPFVIYYIFNKIKNKKINIEMITLFTICSFMFLLLIGLFTGYVSTYYFMKPYFLLNAILLILFYKSLCLIIDRLKLGKIFSLIFISLYCIILILNIIFVNIDPNGFKTYNESYKKLFDIYNSNKAVMKLIQNEFTEDRIETLKYIYENKLIEKQNLLYLGDYIDNFLFKMFFTYENREGIDKPNINEHIQKWNKGEYEYLVVFLKKSYLNYYSKVLRLQNSKIIFETENCAIYEFAN